ncbi:MAG: LysR family transcriptional regulator ArgP [Burkholderiaceae bacterium]
MNNLDPQALECLAAIVEEGGFERAAQRLNITQSAVSQRLRALEAQAGTVLVVRSRPLRATAAGQLFIKHTKMLRLLRADLEREWRDIAPGHEGSGGEEEGVSVAINADSIATWALPALDSLARSGAPVEIFADDQAFTQDWLRQGQVMGCVTSMNQVLRGCRMVALGSMDYIAVATPDYAHAHVPKGLSAHNFHRLQFVAHNRKDFIPREFIAKAFDLSAPTLRRVFTPSSTAQVRVTQAGWGVGVLPRLMVQDLVDAGELVHLLPSYSHWVDLYWHCWNLDSDVLANLTLALTDAASLSLRAPARG